MTDAGGRTDLGNDDVSLTELDVLDPGSAEAAAVKEPRRPFRSAERIGGLAVSLGVMLWMMWPAFKAKLGIIDDHEIVDMIGRHSHLSPWRIPYEIATRTNEANGRFRPFYWVIRVIESSVAGHNGTLWYVDRFLFAAVAVAAIYLTAVRFMAPIAAVAVSLIAFGGPQWEAFIRLGPNEAYAFPIAVAGIAVIVGQLASARPPARLWPGFLLLALAAYTKENFFVLLLFAVPIVALVHGVRRLTRNDYLVLGATTVVALVDVAFILLVVHEYGAVYPQSRTWGTFRAWTTYALAQSNLYEYCTVGIVAALALLAVWSTTRRRLLVSGSLIAIMALIAVPQLGFYAGNPQVGRYLYPLVLVPTMAWAVALWRAGDQRVRIARLLTTSVLLLALAWPLHHALYLSHVGAEQAAANTQTFQTNLKNLINVAISQHDDAVVLQPVDSLIDGERTLSLGRYIGNTTSLKVMMLPPSTVTPGQNAQIAAQMAGWSKHGFGAISPYSRTARCLSVVYGAVKPLCANAITPPG